MANNINITATIDNGDMKYISKTVSLPEKLARELDKRRGDIPRSIFIRRILEKALGIKVEEL